MNTIKVAIIAIAFASTVSTGYAFTQMSGMVSNAKPANDERTILGHRIGSNGQEILVYAE